MSRTSSLTQRAYVSLREELLACRLRPGERLNIKELASRLQVSLGAVREALSRLTSEGLVVLEARRGFRAAPISESDLLDLSSVRIMVEAECLRRAIASGDIGWEASIVSAFHRLSRTDINVAGDPNLLSDHYASAHGAFHAALVSACDSPWLLRVRDLLYAQSERYRYLAVPLAKNKRNVGSEHQDLMQCCLNRDADKAVEALSRHLQATAAILLSTDISILVAHSLGGGAIRGSAALLEPQTDAKNPARKATISTIGDRRE